MVISKNIRDYSIKKPNGEVIELSQFKGKVLLIVNTATKCGLTPQFAGLEKLHLKYKDKGLVVLGCPCNQFGGQEPLSNDEMESSCEINHGVTFQLTEKIEVNGKNTHPLYMALRKSVFSLLGSKIKWNFTKFIVNKNGKVVKRLAPVVLPSMMEKSIEKLL